MINPRKVYVVDPGFVAASTFNIHDKVEALLENLVFLKLRSSQDELYYFKENYNCDFIVFGKDKALKAVQVCAHLQPDNLELELNGLFEAMDYFQFTESTLVTMNQTDRFERDGKIIDVVPFYTF
jgi:predicted AAA+ superfamily ATPase